MLYHANLAAMATMMVEAPRLTRRTQPAGPAFFHVNGIVVSVLSPLLAGGRVTVTGRFQADTFFQTVEAVRPTYFSAVPTIYATLRRCPESQRPDTSSVRFAACGAAPMPAELIERVRTPLRLPDRRGLRALGGHLRLDGQSR